VALFSQAGVSSRCVHSLHIQEEEDEERGKSEIQINPVRK
jgi:hypothetical protein